MKTTPDTPAESLPARQKLLDAGLRLFANRGYDGASTREIADLAGVNVSSIRYYFGDKAGLYKAIYTEALMAEYQGRAASETPSRETPQHSLRHFFQDFLSPLKRGETVHLVMKIHFREMIEPTQAWESQIQDNMRYEYERLESIVAQVTQFRPGDTELQRITFSLLGMAVNFYVAHDFATRFTPRLLKDSDAIDTLADRLADYAMAVIKSEQRKRARQNAGKTTR